MVDSIQNLFWCCNFGGVVFNYIVGKGVSVPAVLLVLVAEKHSVVGVFIDTVVFENIVGILMAY